MPTPPPPSYSYAPAGPLVASALRAYAPPARISTADFAAANRYLANEGGGYVGRWDHTRAPYLVEIMDALDAPEHQTVAIVGPGQCGKTASVENYFFRCVVTDPAPMLWFMQTAPGIEAYVKKTINPLIESHPSLNTRLGPKRTDDSLSFKGFLGAPTEFLSATRSNLINKSAARIIADEWDAYDLGEDPKPVLDVRRQTYGAGSKLIAISHPDKADGSAPEKWTRGIMSLYRDSDRRSWWWQCPHCAMWSSPNPGAAKHMALHYADKGTLDEVEASARLVCPHNGCLIEDAERRQMNLTGRWVAEGQQIDEETGAITGAPSRRETAGFWIVGVMSPFIMGGIGGLARALAKAQREYEATGADDSLRQVVVKQAGLPFDPPRVTGSLDAETLAERADATLALFQVPTGVRFITVALDVQDNRFELLWRGWGIDRESWVLGHKSLPADPRHDANDWDRALALAADPLPLADGSGRVMHPRAIGFDSAGSPGVTVQAYAAWRRAKRDNRVRRAGLISGRDAYTLLPLKGASTRQAAVLQVVYPDSNRRDRFTGVRGEVPLGLYNPNWHKDQLAAQLARAEQGPGYVHVPAALRAPESPHPFFEQLVAERRLPNGVWEKLTARNEVLDLMVMTGVMAHLFAPSRFDWQRPPPWARPWSDNPLVTAAPTAGAAQPVPSSPAVPDTVSPRVAAVLARVAASRAARQAARP